MAKSRIDITGIGCICALGSGFRQTMNNLYKGVCSPAPPNKFAIDQPETYPVFEVDDSGLSHFGRTTQFNRTTQLALTAVEEALNDASLSRKQLTAKRVGICIGTTVGNSLNNEEFYTKVQKGQHPPLDEIHRYLHSNPAEVIAREYHLNGPVLSVANACSSGTDALGIGRSWLDNDLCDVVIAGGAEELSRISYLGFISLMIHSAKPCTPFDADRSGLNLGEGAAILVMEKNKKKHSRGYLAGFGMGCDAYHLTAPHPQGLGLNMALKMALKDAGLDSVDAINAHGTGTLDNDRVEMKSINDLFPTTPYFSVKGATGHTLGAAGAIEAAISLGCLHEKLLPKSIGFFQAENPEQSLPLLENISFSGSTIASQSLAFGGNNSVVIFGQ